MPEYLSTSVKLTNVDLSYKEIKDDTVRCPPPEAEWDYKTVRIYIHRANEYAPGAETEVNERIAEYEQLVIEGHREDFRLLEKNRVIIAGLEGWEIVTSYTSLPVTYLDDPCPRTRAVRVISRYVFFDYQDTVWRIYVSSDAGNADQTKLDYEHILGTLRILD